MGYGDFNQYYGQFQNSSSYFNRNSPYFNQQNQFQQQQLYDFNQLMSQRISMSPQTLGVPKTMNIKKNQYLVCRLGEYGELVNSTCETLEEATSLASRCAAADNSDYVVLTMVSLHRKKPVDIETIQLTPK